MLLDGGEDEGWCVAVGEEGNVAKDEFCAVGSFLTTSVIQFQAMKSTLTNLWHPHGGMTIFYLSEKHAGEDPMMVPLVHVDFWVLIHDLPSGLILEKIGPFESFSLVRMVHERMELPLEWDLSIKAT
ncbi:hypothetical protein Golax_000060 [Gossypium laxum]|uniref:DUF4283 domain-containing protein n=1 Tax=Gossypium laxum TaxID=34288 RepID=A0A7J9AZ73_9ROSI|nr:hypothetical protein [Gossypium laxum]